MKPEEDPPTEKPEKLSMAARLGEYFDGLLFILSVWITLLVLWKLNEANIIESDWVNIPAGLAICLLTFVTLKALQPLILIAAAGSLFYSGYVLYQEASIHTGNNEKEAGVSRSQIHLVKDSANPNIQINIQNQSTTNIQLLNVRGSGENVQETDTHASGFKDTVANTSDTLK